MKKKRINLAEKFPRYFAASQRTENFAELSDQEEEHLDKIEEHITQLQEEITELKKGEPSEEEEEEEEPATPAPAQANAASPEIAAMQSQINALKALIDKKPAADSTVVVTDGGSEGGSKAKPKTYATSVDAELQKFFK